MSIEPQKVKVEVSNEFYQELLYQKIRIPEIHFNKIKYDIINLRKNELKEHNHTLAGNISEEYILPDEINDEIAGYVMESVKYFELSDHAASKRPDFGIPSSSNVGTYEYFVHSWVNFQKKYEFNPMHNHSGKYSYVLWVQIPYDLEEELSQDNSRKSNTPCNSKFEFIFPDIYGIVSQRPLNIDKNWEGVLIVFPSNLKHTVYPFYTSDDYRISVSGNVYLERKAKNN